MADRERIRPPQKIYAGGISDPLFRYFLQVANRINEILAGTQMGDGTNYTEIEDDGTIHMVGDATVWDDVRITPGSFDRPGASDPAIEPYQPGGSGTTTYLYEFAKNDIVSFAVQLPHSYKTGSDIYVHLHWTPGPNGATESGNYVGWKIDYTWANINGTFSPMATADLSDPCTGTDHLHEMTTDVAITGTNKSISSMLLCNLKRTDTGTDDTWSGSASGSLPMILEVDFHFEKDTIGSRLRTSKSSTEAEALTFDGVDSLTFDGITELTFD